MLSIMSTVQKRVPISNLRACPVALFVCIGCWATSIAWAGNHEIAAVFDVPIDAMNKVLATSYYRGDYPTRFQGSASGAGLFEGSLTLDQPGGDDVNVFEIGLFVDVRLHVALQYELDEASGSFDKTVNLRFALKKDVPLKRADVPIQFIGEQPPLLVRELLARELNRRMPLADFVMTKANILTALTTGVTDYASTNLSFEWWMDPPYLTYQRILIKPLVGGFARQPGILDLRVPMHAVIHLGDWSAWHDFEVKVELFSLNDTPVDAITDDSLDAVVGLRLFEQREALGARLVLVFRRDTVLELDAHDVGTAGQCLGKHVRAKPR